MILAMLKLKQTLVRHFPVTAGAGRVEPHPLRCHSINPQGAPVQRRLKRMLGGIVAQQVQPPVQTIVAEVQRPHHSSQASLQYVKPARRPFLRLVQAVIPSDKM